MDPHGNSPHVYGACNLVRTSPRISMVESTYAEGARLPTHTHGVPYICVVLDGAFDESTGRRIDALSAGATVFHPAGETHRNRFHSSTRCLSVTVAQEWLRDDATVASACERRIVARRPGPAAIGRRLRFEARRQAAAADLTVDALAMLLFADIVRAVRVERRIPRWVTEAQMRMRDDPASVVSVAALAQSLGLNPIHFSRTFLVCVGAPPSAYLRQCRVERARLLIQGSELRLAEVALRVGLYDQSHLTRCFQAAFGVTPGVWRRDARRGARL